MNSNLVSTHIFLYYEITGKYVLSCVSQFYKGPIFLSLVKNNPANQCLIDYASHLFEDINIIYVDNAGSDQYGFYHSLSSDQTNKPWIFYCHDKHVDKKQWLYDILEIYTKYDDKLLNNDGIGIISSEKHKMYLTTLKECLEQANVIDIKYRKKSVESMHTVIWLYELARIFCQKYHHDNSALQDLQFSAGNIFLIKTNIAKKAHSCVEEEFFNKNVYREDGEVEHGMERFYFYVSKAMGFNNLFI